MAKVAVLVEVMTTRAEAFAESAALAAAPEDAVRRGEELLRELAGFGLEVRDDVAPVPMFAPATVAGEGGAEGFAAFAGPAENADVAAASVVVSCRLDAARVTELAAAPGVRVWPSSEMSYCADAGDDVEVDCPPFAGAATADEVRELLGVAAAWDDGSRGQGVAVAVIDEGIDGDVYPVAGGYARPGARQPGRAEVTSHGSMAAAAVRVAAPEAPLYDYPFLGQPTSGGALQMFQAILDQRRRDGTPRITNSSYAFTTVPPRAEQPWHEVWAREHPVNRKVVEVAASGAAVFFAAGNCGGDCPFANCDPSSVGPGRSIHAANSLEAVITVAAVNPERRRLGYSGEGPGMFAPDKPDLAAYSHFYGNFGPGRPAGGGAAAFDAGTSAACPVAAGVAALLLSAFPELGPEELRAALVAGAADVGEPGWDTGVGHGVIDAGASYRWLTSVAKDGEIPL